MHHGGDSGIVLEWGSFRAHTMFASALKRLHGSLGAETYDQVDTRMESDTARSFGPER